MQSGQVVPEGLAAMAAGPELGALLARIDPTGVCNDDIVDVLTAQSRQLAHDQARMFTALDQVIHRLPFAGPGQIRRAEHPERHGPDEVRAALAWTRRAADAETDLAHTLVRVLPLVHAALAAGDIDRPKAAVFARHLDDLSPAQITTVCRAVLPHAPRLTTGQITDRIRRLILELDPAYYRRRYHKAVRDRMVIAYLAHDGTAVLTANGLPADEAAAAWERLDALAHTARRDGHPATLDQIRADLVLGLLDGTLHGLSRTQILHALLERFAGHTDTGSGGSGGRSGSGGSGGGRSGGGGSGGGGGSAGSSCGDSGSGGSGGGSGSNGSGSAGAVVPVHDDPNTATHDHPTGGGGDHTSTDHTSTRTARTSTRTARTGPAHTDPDRAGAGTEPESRPAPDQRVGTEIRIPLSTLLGLDDRPGELPGWGPVPADPARRTVARQRRAQWRWVVVDHTGHLLADGITRRRPSHLTRSGPPGGVVEIQVPATLLATLAATPDRHGPWATVITDIAARYTRHRAQDPPTADLDAHPQDRYPRAALRRHTQVRDRTCIHPGCRTPARRADTDHTLDHTRGGTTTHDDLAPLCRHDHMLKTEGGWHLQQPEPGRFLWHSPLGRTYPVEPEPILPPPPHTGHPRPRPQLRRPRPRNHPGHRPPAPRPRTTERTDAGQPRPRRRSPTAVLTARGGASGRRCACGRITCRRPAGPRAVGPVAAVRVPSRLPADRRPRAGRRGFAGAQPPGSSR